MIKETEIEINGHSSNYKYYRDLGYDVCVRKPFLVNPIHLMKGSMVKITCICDNCGKEVKNIFKDYWNYTNGLTNPYYCNSCKNIKSEETSLERWGVKNPMQSDYVKNKLKSSLLDKYGVDHYSKTPEWLEKYKKTSIYKYGVDNPSKFDIFKEKIVNTNLTKYGGHPSKTDSFKKVIKNHRKRKTYKKYLELISEKYDVISYNDQVFEILHKECNNIIKVQKGLLYSRYKLNKMICPICNPIGNHISEFENEICNFIDELGVIYIRNTKEILNGKELDIYIPSVKLAIEANGVFWHSELFKKSDYHIQKTKECSDLGISLIHIWEDDWNNKREIVKSIIRNRLKYNIEKIWARKCIIRNVSTKEYKDFLNKNHIQGYSPSSINIGLYYKDQLVSLMTFGYRRTNNKKEYELIRFCNILNTNVIGSASKLFKYFIRNYEYNNIVSYADISLFNGYIYREIGFYSKGISKPNYFWVGNDGIRKHRYNFSKRKLVSKGYDINKTEVEIMHELGYYRIYSTGQEKYIFDRILTV